MSHDSYFALEKKADPIEREITELILNVKPYKLFTGVGISGSKSPKLDLKIDDLTASTFFE